jgi:hypothetical protein
MATAPPARTTDLTAEAFLVLRNSFFSPSPIPKPYDLRDKRNTQDDPLDEYIHKILSEDRELSRGTHCSKASGPLITPDLVLFRTSLCQGALRADLRADLSRIVGIEVKKLERHGGAIARASGMDFNTTPPCGTVRVYDPKARPIDIRGFYLFVCQEPVTAQANRFSLTAMVLCDGNLLNADFELYLTIVGVRTKQIGLGTYRDGANRTRPMLIFANPLGVDALDHQVTLIHARGDLEREFPDLRRVGLIHRTTGQGASAAFHCYRARTDVAKGQRLFELTDPFPTPTRTERTQIRGRFRIALEPAD